MIRARRDFITKIRRRVKREGFRFQIAPKKLYLNGFEVGGYFDEGDGLFVNTKKEESAWLMILIHEYCHFLQYMEGAFTGGIANNYFERLGLWLEKDIELTAEEALECVMFVVECEVDCERRAIQLIRDNPDLQIDVHLYTKKANAYILFHAVVLEDRIFYDRKSPYKVPEILEQTPDDELIDTFLIAPTWYKNLIRKYC